MTVLIVIVSTLALVAVLGVMHGYETVAPGKLTTRLLWLAVPPACVALLKPEPLAWIPAVALVSIVLIGWVNQRAMLHLGVLVSLSMTVFRRARAPLSYHELAESIGRSAWAVVFTVAYLERYQMIEHDPALYTATPIGKIWHAPLFRVRQHQHGAGCTCNGGTPA